MAALRRVSRAGAAATVLIGSAVLASWTLGIELLRSYGSSVTAKPNTGIGLVLLGVASLCAGRSHRAAALAAQVLGGAVALLGAAALAQHLFGRDLGIDQLLFREAPGAAGTASPNRMGPPSATNLFLAGLAIVLLEVRQRGARWHAQAIALAVAPVPLIGVVGYAYGVDALYAPVATGIALPTALGLLLVDASIVLARPDRGFVANLASEGTGSALARRMLAFGALAPVALGGLALAGERLGFYDGAFAVAVLAVAITMALVLLVFRDALVIDRMEAAKKHALAERERSREELARALRREQEAREHAETANRAKDQFLATLSHELRTPLNAILGWNRLLRDAAGDPQRFARGLAVIERNGRALAQLVADLLDMSRIASGKLQVDRVEVDLAPVLDAAIETVIPAAEAKGIELVRRYDPATPRVVGDPTRLQQVAWNLLSNAVKFTPSGGRVEVVLAPEAGRATIAVSDTGAGIAADFLPLVFDQFAQADGSSTRRHGGLGLGLAISRQLVSLHGGSIRAESAGPGRGATFRVELPPSPSAAVAAERSERRRHDLGGARVLVVDDEGDSRELLLQLLASWGARVRGAASVAEAVGALAAEPAELVVSDIAMPGEDGFALLERLRRDGAAQVPVVALTAFARPEDRRRILAAGFDAHVAKPVEPDELRASLAALLGRAGRREAGQVARAPAGTSVVADVHP